MKKESDFVEAIDLKPHFKRVSIGRYSKNNTQSIVARNKDYLFRRKRKVLIGRNLCKGKPVFRCGIGDVVTLSAKA